MNTRRFRFSDLFVMSLVGTPLVGLASMLLAGMVSWTMNESSVVSEATSAIGLASGADLPSLSAWYAKHTSKPQTLARNELQSACMSIRRLREAQLAGDQWSETVSADLDAVPPNEAELIEQFATLGRPVLTELQSIVATAPLNSESLNVWRGFAFGDFADRKPLVSDAIILSDVLSVELTDAYLRQDHERAMQAINLADQLFGPSSGTTDWQSIESWRGWLHTIRTTLPGDFWTDPELSKLQTLLADEFEWQAVWNESISLQVLIEAPWVLSGDLARLDLFLDSYWPLLHHYAISNAEMAPSERLVLASGQWRDLIDNEKKLRPGTQEHVEAINEELLSRAGQHYRFRWDTDCLLKRPDMRPVSLGNSPRIAERERAYQILETAMDRLFTRAAIAIKQYRLNLGRYPASLDDLHEVGWSDRELKQIKEYWELRVDDGKVKLAYKYLSTQQEEGEHDDDVGHGLVTFPAE